MGKQFEFYSYKNDDEMIANTLRSVFGELLCVPRYKGDLSPFDICANDRLMYLTGKSFQQYISYYTHEYYDGTTAEVLDYVKSPVLEYRVPFQRENQKEFSIREILEVLYIKQHRCGNISVFYTE